MKDTLIAVVIATILSTLFFASKANGSTVQEDLDSMKEDTKVMLVDTKEIIKILKAHSKTEGVDKESK